MSEGSSDETRKKIRRLEIITARLVEQVFAGQYESLFKGRGIEFSEFREYFPGDDIRNIDWNVTARLGRPFVKRNEEERELSMMLVVDTSESQAFGSGSRSKRELAGEIGAILAFAALRNGDKVGLMLFSDEVNLYLPPRKGKRHALRLIRDILEPPEAGTGTDLEHALSYFNRLHRRKALVFVLSDFLIDEFQRPDTHAAIRLLRSVSSRHDLSAFRLTDQREETLPALGRLRLRDLETGKTMLVDTNSPGFREAYEKRAEERRARLKKIFDSSRVDHAEFSTDSDPVPGLIRFFARKKARRWSRA